MSLGEKLRILRIKSKKTLHDQSAMLGVSMNSVYRWEHDLAVPRHQTLKVLADIYAVPLDWLLTEGSASSLVNDLESKLICMFRKLSDGNRFKVMGYIERICVEEYGFDVIQ